MYVTKIDMCKEKQEKIALKFTVLQLIFWVLIVVCMLAIILSAWKMNVHHSYSESNQGMQKELNSLQIADAVRN